MQIWLKAPSFLNVKKVILCISLFSAQLARKKKKKKGIFRNSQQRESLFLGANRERKQDALKVALLAL